VNTRVHDDCEVAVIGAGPYGLAVAAHLKAAAVAVRIFGDPMSFWRDNMPKGMRLRSPWNATHIADPLGQFSLDVFAHRHGIAPVRNQLPLAQFLRYGEWFQQQAVPEVDARKVARVERGSGGFRLRLEDDDLVHARRVVVAMGLARQEIRPTPFADLPAALVSHACEHATLERWRGKRVAVIGRGQSACESAALLHEAGSEVELVCRGPIRWIGAPSGAARRGVRVSRWRDRLRAPSAVGPPGLEWLNELPGVEHRLPARLRSWISMRSLRAGAAWWVKPGFEGVRVLAGQAVIEAKAEGDRVALRLADGQRDYDHVLLATGYRIDVGRLGVLAPELLDGVARVDGAAVLAPGFESTVPGLHFVGSSAVHSFGPLMRFIAGAGYAARGVTRGVLARRARSKPASGDATAGNFRPAKDAVPG